MRSMQQRISVPLPTPEGPVITNTRATGWEATQRLGGNLGVRPAQW